MTVTMTVLKDRKDWLQHRHSYIGGSDASAIVAMNPYMTNIDLWEIKTGIRVPEDISKKDYVQYGTKAEKHLRDLFKLDYPQYKVEYKANNSWHNDKYPWAAASLDGVLTEKETGRKGILEIKTTNILQSMQKEKWNHRIPDSYFCQICHYLAVTEFEFAKLRAQLKSEFDGEVYLQTKTYTIEKSEILEDIEYLMNEEKKFWEYVERRKRPGLVLPMI